ncbi:MAG: hypothetical protein P9L99_13355 [Candidatus Lernaella stagnicola]|nr:hypothetical protein [Candidatus Lernaella stagnicola]
MKATLYLFALLAILAIVFACGAAGDDDDDDAASGNDDDDDDNDDNDDDDTAADDDTAGDDDTTPPSCGAVWIECEYENHWYQHDAVRDACGEAPDAEAEWSIIAEYYACSFGQHAAHHYGIESCGRDLGCDDWKADWYECSGDRYQAAAGCYEASITREDVLECVPDEADYWCRTID